MQVGLVFIISGGTYALTAPFIGYVCEIGLNPKKIMISGTILTIISYAIVGPAPGLPIEKYGRIMRFWGFLFFFFSFVCYVHKRVKKRADHWSRGPHINHFYPPNRSYRIIYDLRVSFINHVTFIVRNISISPWNRSNRFKRV